MPTFAAADTIRILVATDNHVGFNERDSIRGDDSWKSFHEVMCLAKERDVDMVLLAGDLFHENKPSRKSMYQVMRSLRMNCYGEKPCELEMLSDPSEVFEGAFNYVNYEDPDINVAIPVFSIHGNHDDPSGEGHLSALDLLQISGLVNYYGRTPESDNILIRPVLLQKGQTKLALYGMSNVRDERLHRSFRDGRVKFFQPGVQKLDWFNLMSVHQNHVAHTDTGYLPENFLPEFLDMVIWGHEHECLIDPRYNPEMNFYVMQPGSSVATSLMPGEAVPKHVAILSITGRDFKVEPIRLKTVRPFAIKEIVLAEHKQTKKLAKKEDNRLELSKILSEMVEELIEQAKEEWKETQESVDEDEEKECPLPLIRLRVEYSAPDGGSFDTENPQRLSNKFVGKVANINDVFQFHRKKAGVSRKEQDVQLPEESTSAQAAIESIKVEKLVREFLTAQSLTILPQNSFGDAVSQFVDKDDKHAMEMFVNESLSNQFQNLMEVDQYEDEELQHVMELYKARLEDLFAKGLLAKARKGKLKPKPHGWDEEQDGAWADQPGALMLSDLEDEEDDDNAASVVAPAKGRGKAAAANKKAAPAKKATAPAKAPARGRKKAILEEEDSDIVMEENIPIEEDNADDDDGLFVKPDPKPRGRPAAAPAPGPKKAAPAPKRAPARAAPAKQSKLNFSQASQASTRSQANGKTKAAALEVSDDAISDDDAFDPPAPSQRTTRKK